MSRKFQIFLQSLGVVAQVAAVTTNLVPSEYKYIPIATVAAIQGTFGIIQANYNPDGTSARASYEVSAKPSTSTKQ